MLPTLDDKKRVVATLQNIVRNTKEFKEAQTQGNLIARDAGDGLALVFFKDANAPLYCAVEIARALKDRPELRLRMGINSGLVSRTTDVNGHDKVSGEGIDMAQRVMDCGSAGHILLSQSCADLMRQISQWAGALHDLGEYPIKHDRTLRLYNLYMDQVGNPVAPPVAPKSATPANAPKKGNQAVTGDAAKIGADRGSGAQNRIRTNPTDDAEMVWKPAGTFRMGSNNGNENEKPVHSVTLSGFWMYKTLVTVAQFRKYDEANGRRYDWAKHKPSWDWLDDHPMVYVTWDEASAYAQWAGVALPTEAQWEYAARGGLEGKNYPWGDDWDWNKCAHSVKPYDLQGTKEVKSYPANGYGLYDMAGNVWQWCADWYDSYYKMEAVQRANPTGPASGSSRVLRGGCWCSYSVTNFRCAYRGGNFPDIRNFIIGFRCCFPVG